MYLCNGSPKTGTHLLCRVVALFENSARSIEHVHEPWQDGLNEKHIHITRIPRNVIISALRFFNPRDGITEDSIIRQIPLTINEMNSYLQWSYSDGVLNVMFEKILSDEDELKRISDYLNLPIVDDHFYRMWGGTSTFSGKLSNWRDHWSDNIEKVYAECGGIKLESALGYNRETIFIRTVDVL